MSRELDNPVWHALAALPAGMAERAPHAARFAAEIAPFFAIDHVGPDAYADLRRLVGAATEARLFRPAREPVPPGWRKTFEKPILQMVLPERVALPPGTGVIETLGAADVPDMLALAGRAHPGPFGARTHELGLYLGIREGGRLVAMAGERFRCAGHVEISAVATDPDHRGRGLGRALTVALARRIRAANRAPFLHVFPDNAAAAALYRALGFAVRRELSVVWLAPDGT